MDPYVRVQNQGQELYKQKDFKAALQCFDWVIAQCADPPLSVLDNRAATYTKLGELQAALRDSRRMIHVGKAEVTGYLRTGQVLQLLDKNETALGIYQYGLKNVPDSNPDVKSLRGMYGKLAAKMSPLKAVDPIQVLPVELAQMILEYLNFNNVVTLLRVSKQWKRLLESLPTLWRHLDLSKTKKKVRLSAVQAYVRRSRGSLTHATLSQYDSVDKNAFAYIASRCKRLQYLELRTGISGESLLKAAPSMSSLKTLIILSGHEISLDTVTQMLAKCHILEHAEFHIRVYGTAPRWEGDLSKLRVLKLHSTKDSSGNRRLELNKLFEKAPHLHELSVQTRTTGGPRIASDFSSLTELRSLALSDVDIETFPCLPHSLQSLTLINTWGIGGRSDHGDAYMALNDFSLLTSLTVSPTRNLLPEAVHALIGTGKNKLTKLDLHAYESTIDIAGLLAAGHLSELKEFRLSNYVVSDQLAESIAARCLGLTQLDLSYNTRLTGVGVKSLVLKPGEKLTTLNLNHCIGVGIDAVDYARGHGIEVLFTFPDNMRYGKRVRLGPRDDSREL